MQIPVQISHGETITIYWYIPINVTQVVWLSDNPLSKEPDYRNQVTQILPQISILDNVG